MIRSNFELFQNRTKIIWKSEPGRSLLVIIPSGCNETITANHITECVQDNFILPSGNEGFSQKVFKITPDTNQSTEHFVSNVISDSEKCLGKTSSAHEEDWLQDKIKIAVDELNNQNIHPIFLVKRFQSFASIYDDSLATILGALREMEHEKKLTSIILSPISYDNLRREMAENPENLSQFINSPYGDNHEKIIIEPIVKDDFISFATEAGISDLDAQSLYSIGGGPDIVYEKLVQNKLLGVENLVQACVTDCGPTFQKFFKDCGLSNKNELLSRLAQNSLIQTDLNFLGSIDLRNFIINSEGQSGYQITSKIMQDHILTKTLLEQPESERCVFDLPVKTMVSIRENHEIEFKPGAFGTKRKNENGDVQSKYELNYIVLEEVAGFLNTNDGVLLLGVSDAQNNASGNDEIIGIDDEMHAHQMDNDKYLRNLDRVMSNGFGEATAIELITSSIDIVDDMKVCRIHVKKSRDPVYIKKINSWKKYYVPPANYVRKGSSTEMIDAEEWLKHCCNNFFLAQNVPYDS